MFVFLKNYVIMSTTYMNQQFTVDSLSKLD